MIQITDKIKIAEKNIIFKFIRSGGPGGQNVNKVSTAVELRFDIKNEINLPYYVKLKLKTIAAKRISKEGILIITAEEHRTQGKNKDAALNRLKNLLIEASYIPVKRTKTKPTRSSKENRLSVKRKISKNKSIRKKSFFQD